VKRLTREQVEARKEKAAQFTETVVGDPDRADEIRDESTEDYAGRRKFEITNPHRRASMPRNAEREKIQDLKERVRELEEENEALQDQLDSIAEIVAPEDSDDTDED
jgi:hypothetical protein